MSTVTPLRTFQLQQQLKKDAAEIFAAGERSGRKMARREADMYAGVTFCIGFAIGVMVAATAIGWLLP